jgi:hypothetical protein
MDGPEKRIRLAAGLRVRLARALQRDQRGVIGNARLAMMCV